MQHIDLAWLTSTFRRAIDSRPGPHSTARRTLLSPCCLAEKTQIEIFSRQGCKFARAARKDIRSASPCVGDYTPRERPRVLGAFAKGTRMMAGGRFPEASRWSELTETCALRSKNDVRRSKMKGSSGKLLNGILQLQNVIKSSFSM